VEQNLFGEGSLHPVVRKLNLFTKLEPQEVSAVELALSRVTEVPGGHDIARQGEEPTTVYFLVDGFACRHRLLDNGRRQILSFLLPGDACDLGVSLLEQRDHTVLAMSRCRVALVADETVRHLADQNLNLKDALQWATLVEESIAREWIANVGQRSSAERMAHLFCEHYHRMRALGLADGNNCELPVSQPDLADTLGLSPVHVNRTLQHLRSRGLLAFGDKRLTILDLPKLESLAAFEPGYLHLGARRRNRA
jgi:CRP-like cAMP-binding protein